MKTPLGAGLLLIASAASAQEDAVVVTATRTPQPSLQVPASVDRLYADEIRQGRPQVNLSESLGRVPGIDGLWVAAGHGPWGISTGPASGRLLADLMDGRVAAPPSALDPARFAPPPLG